MSQPYIPCPQTGRSMYIGLNLEWINLDALDIGPQQISCPECGSVHTWVKEDIRLRADGAG
jgi:hypothetical protein